MGYTIMCQFGGKKLLGGALTDLSSGPDAGPLRQQSQSLLVIHRLPRDKLLGKHIHSAKER